MASVYSFFFLWRREGDGSDDQPHRVATPSSAATCWARSLTNCSATRPSLPVLARQEAMHFGSNQVGLGHERQVAATGQHDLFGVR